MYCDHCGAALQGDANFCRACGRPVGGAPAVPGRTVLGGHVRLLGILWLAISAMRLLPAFSLFWVAPRMHWLPPWNFLYDLLPVIGVGLLSSALVGFAAGWGLLRRERWARVVTIVLGAIALIDVPLGTALGIYTLWVLLPERSRDEFHAVTA
jgi:hypothetical protein